MKDEIVEEAKHGYWMYSDGSSCWSTGLYRGEEKPFEITKEMHVNKKKVTNEDGVEREEELMTIEQRKDWHKEELAKRVEAKRKKAEEESKKAKAK